MSSEQWLYFLVIFVNLYFIIS